MTPGLRLALLLALAALVAACSRSLPGFDGYPKDWTAPRPAREGSTLCADLSGRYIVGEGVLAVLFAGRRGEAPRAHWDTLVIDGNSSSGFGLQLEGGTAAGERVTATLPRLHPQCREGWARVDLPHGTDFPLPRSPGDDRRAERYVLLAPDRDNNLVAQLVTVRVQVLSLWAETGAGIPIPFTMSTDRAWSRWMADTGQPRRGTHVHLLAADADPELARLGTLLPPDAEIVSRRTEANARIVELRVASHGDWLALQESLRGAAFGSAEATRVRQSSNGPVTGIVRVEPMPTAPRRTPAQVAAAKVEHAQLDAATRAVVKLLPPGAGFVGARHIDGGVQFDVRLPDEAALASFVAAIGESPSFGIPQVRGTTSAGRNAIFASVWVRLR